MVGRDLEAVKMLLAKSPADVNAKDKVWRVEGVGRSWAKETMLWVFALYMLSRVIVLTRSCKSQERTHVAGSGSTLWVGC